jgi:hypothetical protein
MIACTRCPLRPIHAIHWQAPDNHAITGEQLHPPDEHEMQGEDEFNAAVRYNIAQLSGYHRVIQDWLQDVCSHNNKTCALPMSAPVRRQRNTRLLAPMAVCRDRCAAVPRIAACLRVDDLWSRRRRRWAAHRLTWTVTGGFVFVWIRYAHTAQALSDSAFLALSLNALFTSSLCFDHQIRWRSSWRCIRCRCSVATWLTVSIYCRCATCCRANARVRSGCEMRCTHETMRTIFCRMCTATLDRSFCWRYRCQCMLSCASTSGRRETLSSQ